MENREVKDIAIIANLLDGKVKFRKKVKTSLKLSNI